MKNIGIVQGSSQQALQLIVGKDTVYVHTNIVSVAEDAEGNPVENLYQYNEIQYDKDEYIKLMSEKSATLETELTSTQLALTEIYESLEA